MTATAETIKEAAAKLGLSMEWDFVPFSASRNKAEKMPSLNWSIRLLHNGRLILTTDYMAGCGRCKAYKASVKALGHQNSMMRDKAVRQECESGREWREFGAGPKIEPNFADVLHSLASDSDAIDCASFEEWAGNLDYDTDSRKAESIYRACLDIALKFRNALGEAGLAELREACADY